MKIKPLHILLSILILALALTACSGGTNDAADNNVMNNNAVDNDVMDNDAADNDAMDNDAADDDAADDDMADEGPCAPATEGPLAGVDPRGQTVVWWHNHSGDAREGFLNEFIPAFNETNECGITVEAQNQGGYNDIRDKMNAGIQTGDVPGLLVGYQNDEAFYALAGGLADINPYMNDATWGLTDEEIADFYPSILAQSVFPAFDGMRLGFPPNRSMEGLYYNISWLKELGFDGTPPATPAEFKEMACAAAEAVGDGTGGYALRDDASATAAWTYAFGGDILTDDGMGYDYSSQATVDALTMLQEMVDEGCAYFYEGYADGAFAARTAVFYTSSSSGLTYAAGSIAAAAEENGTEPDEWGFAAIPHTTADPVQNIYGGDVMIAANTPEIELATWIFVKYLTSPEVQAAWVRASGYFPTRASVADELTDFLAENTQFAQAYDLVPYGYYEPQLISYQGVRDLAEQAYNEIMQGADVQTTLDQLTADANALQEELAP